MLGSLAVGQADGSLPLVERLTHLDMSHRLGCSREMVSRLMQDLERGGYVSPQGPLYRLDKPLPQRW